MPGEVSTRHTPYPALTAIPQFPVLVPEAVDHRSHHEADRIVITYPLPGSTKFINVTWAEFGHAVDSAAWVLDQQLVARRSSDQPVKTVGILARSDPAYMVTVYALHKCGITPLLLSTRNSHAAIVNLLRLTGAIAILSDVYHREEAELSAAEVGSIPIFDLAPLPGPSSGARKPFPFHLKYEDELDNPAVILHTSGSTGLPKPVAWSTRFFWHHPYYPQPFIDKYNGSSMLLTLPIFHGSGFALIRTSLLMLGWRVIFPDSSKPVTASAIIDICNNPSVSPDIVTGAPSVIEEIPTLPRGWEAMYNRRSWFFMGAPVPPHFGDELVRRGIHFNPNLGSTEIGQMNVLEPEGRPPADWNYHQIRPDLDFILEPRGSDPGSGPFELIILSKDGWSPGVLNVKVNGVEGYATSDLYQKHPTLGHLIKHCGRVDDVVVLSNGEKTLSRAIEIPIEADPRVRDAIVFGTGRTQNGVMIVPAPEHVFDAKDPVKLAEFRESIWPSIEKANSINPTHSQIWKEMVLLTHPDKELPRTDKGSVKRKLAIELYSKEIDELYIAVDELTSAEGPPLPESLDVESLVPFFTALINQALGKLLKRDDDIFNSSMDSLKAIFLRSSLVSALKSDVRTEMLAAQVPQNFVYSNTSALAMAEAISQLAVRGHLIESGQETAEEHAKMINEMVSKYTQGFPTHIPSTGSIGGDRGETVVLTGSTGSLGTYLLNALIASPDVTQIHAFNRQTTIPTSDRQQLSYLERELDLGLLTNAISSGRLVFHDVALHQPQFGLPLDVYDRIRETATLIIHNAWAVNFNWTLDTFESVHIKGLRNLIDFSLSSPLTNPPSIAFTSSISTVGAFAAGDVPEETLGDPAVCMPHGYARAKFVGERMLAIASEKTDMKSFSFRIGQISGDSVHGIWNETDSVPALLKGCQELGAIPTDWVPVVAWTPADVVAQVIIDVCLNKDRTAGTFHVANPKPTPWKDLVPFVRRNIMTHDGHELEEVTMQEWISRLKESDHPADVNPAMKLVAFFENAMNGKGVRCRLGLDKTKAASPALRDASAVDETALKLFLDYWKRIQFLRA